MALTKTLDERPRTSRHGRCRSPKQIAALHVRERLDRYVGPSQATCFAVTPEPKRAELAASASRSD
jgi:hypothetical protein